MNLFKLGAKAKPGLEQALASTDGVIKDQIQLILEDCDYKYGSPSEGIVVGISVNKTVFKSDEEIIVRFRVKNINPHSIYWMNSEMDENGFTFYKDLGFYSVECISDKDETASIMIGGGGASGRRSGDQKQYSPKRIYTEVKPMEYLISSEITGSRRHGQIKCNTAKDRLKPGKYRIEHLGSVVLKSSEEKTAGVSKGRVHKMKGFPDVPYTDFNTSVTITIKSP
ncbi:hypothetical protein ACFL54_07970 [Planctomycetota bacterium]